jgi:phage-related protein (TIGR01555 family)
MSQKRSVINEHKNAINENIKPMSSANMRIAANKMAVDKKSTAYAYEIKPPELVAGIAPKDAKIPVLAMDTNQYDYAQEFSGQFPGGGFPGFPYLARLATRAEYRAFASAISTELTRKWIEIVGTSDDADDATKEKIKGIEGEMKRLDVRGVFQAAAAHDCFFGRGQIFISINNADDKKPLILSPKTIKQGSLKGISAVEAMWTTPSAYNAINPAAIDFYKPSSWFMLGQEVHASRLLTIVTRPLPDMLKPAFNFAGMSLSQLAEPYVENWLRTRQSVSDLINNFSITALATSMEGILSGDDDGSGIVARAELFNATRSNKGLMLLDKEREEIQQTNVPLSGLHELQSQSQEHMCSASRIPAIILTGISPSGLNASSEGEIRVFYDWIKAQQEAFWRSPLESIIKVIQLSLFGEIDPNISFKFESLYEMTEIEESTIRMNDAQAAQIYIGNGVIDPSEERERLSKDPHSGYDSLDMDVEIVAPIDDLNESDINGELTEDKSISEKQHRAMAAAAAGHSTIGIPQSVGKEFIEKDK